MKKTTTSLFYFYKPIALILLAMISSQTLWAQLDSTHFVSTWLTSMQGSSNSQSITLFTDANYSYNYDVDWDNDGVFEDTNVRGNITHQYASTGRYTIRIKGIFPRIYFGDSTNSSAWLTDRKKLLFIDQWGTQQWKNLAHAFNGCEFMSLRATDVPNLSQVKNMKYLFANINGTFNSSISNWDVSQVTNMEGVFNNAVTFNEPIGTWQVDSVKTMESLFEGATAFNQPIGNWQVDSVRNMEKMFYGTSSFNQPIGNWNVSNVRSMYYMFWSATSFNQSIGNWDVSNVTNMNGLFHAATAFNQPLNNWDVSSVIDMGNMFVGATSFNQSLNNWDVSSVTNMNSMFNRAISFNQPIGNWNVSNVNRWQGAFRKATAFDQNIGDWDMSNLYTAVYMLDSCGMSTANYDSTLIGWQSKFHRNNVSISVGGLIYCASDSVRNLLITNSGWTFIGDTLNCVTVGIEKHEKQVNHFKVYPNPAQGQLTIESSTENRNVPLFIYNTQGQKVKSIRLESQMQQIDLSDLPAGLYFMIQGESRQKLMLEK